MTDTVWTIIHRLLLDNSKRIAEAQLAGTHEEYSAIINGVSAHIAGKVEEHLGAALPAPADDARGYLIRNVLEPVWPGIHPLPDLMGVCTQVDHVMAGQMGAIAEVYAMLWSIVTDDARIHRARRILLDAMGGQGSTRQKLALEKYGKAPADLPITAMGDDAVRGELVVALKEARDCVASWGAYASDYFQKKHDLAGDLARIDAALARAGESQ